MRVEEGKGSYATTYAYPMVLCPFPLMLQQSDLLSEEEKQSALEHLKPFMRLIKSDTDDE